MYRTAVLVVVIASSQIAGTIHYSWNASASDVQIDRYGEWDVISIAGGLPLFANGYPNLPAVSRSYVIPQGTTVTGVEVTVNSTVSLGRALFPAPVTILPVSSDVVDFPDYTEVCLDGMSGSFPSSSIAGFKTGTKTGFRIGSYSFVPFTYDLQTGELLLVTSADINLVYQYDPEAPVYSLTRGQVELAETGLSVFIDNPEMLESMAPSRRDDTDEDVEVIVVGYDEQSAQLADLISLYSSLGYVSESVTVQWLEENGDGFDIQEKIRNYIKNLYENNGLLFAVMCGDRGETTRLSMLEGVVSPQHMNTTVDLYFSDLDGTWDGNGNHMYGEEFDDVDYYSDIYVGRYPVTLDETDAFNTMIEKTVQYNTAPAAGDWQKRALLMGAVLWLGQPQAVWGLGSKHCDSVATFFPSDWSWNTVYQDTTCYHPNNQLELFNQGTAFSMYASHGNPSGCFWYNRSLDAILNCDTVQYMNNGGALPWVAGAISCETGRLWPGEGFAEVIVEHEGGGAVVITASSNSSFGALDDPGPVGWLSIYFADLLFAQGLVTAGVTHGISKDMLWANWNGAWVERVTEWQMQVVNLYGDPCTVFVDAPEGVESDPAVLQTVRVAPNPVRAGMSITVTLPEASQVKIAVYDMFGRIALISEEEIHGAGEQSVSLDVSSLASGIYLVNAVAGGYSSSVKCVVLH